jgi:hypothetical protein
MNEFSSLGNVRRIVGLRGVLKMMRAGRPKS